MEIVHFNLSNFQIIGIERVIEYHGIEEAINFYLDILIGCLCEYPDEKYRYEHIYNSLKYILNKSLI